MKLPTYFGDGVHVMADLETLGTDGGVMIPQIGAVAFRPNDPPGTFLGTFVQWCSLTEQQDCGLRMDARTVQWWFEQDPEAIRAVFGKHNPKVNIHYALTNFSDFCSAHSAERLWGHGATFDNVVLAAAFKATHVRPSVGFRGARDTRTLFDMVGGGDWSSDEMIDMDAFGPKHDALADAKRQVVVVQRALRSLRGG